MHCKAVSGRSRPGGGGQDVCLVRMQLAVLVMHKLFSGLADVTAKHGEASQCPGSSWLVGRASHIAALSGLRFGSVSSCILIQSGFRCTMVLGNIQDLIMSQVPMVGYEDGWCQTLRLSQKD
ncbi:hypothetical protein J1614_006841 [Plenodomus biglobosus]|nr:hypothetical protein J1614_006841 [Plenodomus biglobosus]